MNEIQLTDIKQIETEIILLKNQTAQNIIEIGKRLIKAKEILSHGEWIPWIENNVEFSRVTANKFMQVATEFPNVSSTLHLGQTKVFALLSLPLEEREEFIEENNVEDMTTRELRQAIKENKELLEAVSKHKDEKVEPVIIEKEVEKKVEVVPDDYQYFKDKEYELSSLLRTAEENIRVLNSKINNQIDPRELERLRKELKEKTLEAHEMDKQIKSLIKVDSKVQHQEKLKDSALIFCTRVHTFLNDVGGLAWLTEYIGELEEYDEKSYIKALDLLEGWVMTVKSNISKGDN